MARRAGAAAASPAMADSSNPPEAIAHGLISLISSMDARAMPMQLMIERAGEQRTYTFQLDVATRVLRANDWKIVDGEMVSLWLPRAYTKCFEQAR